MSHFTYIYFLTSLPQFAEKIFWAVSKDNYYLCFYLSILLINHRIFRILIKDNVNYSSLLYIEAQLNVYSAVEAKKKL